MNAQKHPLEQRQADILRAKALIDGMTSAETPAELDNLLVNLPDDACGALMAYGQHRLVAMGALAADHKVDDRDFMGNIYPTLEKILSDLEAKIAYQPSDAEKAMTAAGGKVWESEDKSKKRVYFNYVRVGARKAPYSCYYDMVENTFIGEAFVAAAVIEKIAKTHPEIAAALTTK